MSFQKALLNAKKKHGVLPTAAPVVPAVEASSVAPPPSASLGVEKLAPIVNANEEETTNTAAIVVVGPTLEVAVAGPSIEAGADVASVAAINASEKEEEAADATKETPVTSTPAAAVMAEAVASKSVDDEVAAKPDEASTHTPTTTVASSTAPHAPPPAASTPSAFSLLMGVKRPRADVSGGASSGTAAPATGSGLTSAKDVRRLIDKYQSGSRRL